MASAATPLPVPKEEEAAAVQQPSNEIVNPADALYDKCAERNMGAVFFQRDLSNMQVAETVAELTTLLQELCDRHLMKLMTLEGEPCWKLRSRSDADKCAEPFLTVVDGQTNDFAGCGN
jgi:DNA-directed RNA polymerase III subunit RPC6